MARSENARRRLTWGGPQERRHNPNAIPTYGKDRHCIDCSGGISQYTEGDLCDSCRKGRLGLGNLERPEV